MSDWKPPPFGTPVWLGIPAQDVERGKNFPLASKFYSTVFRITFKAPKNAPDPKHEQLFDFTSQGLNITGGILKAPDSSGAFTTGRGGVCIHWFVEDIDDTAKIIESAGGRMVSEKEKESESGMYRYFEDTEGNVGSVYMALKNKQGNE
ncbi:hypothetical protein PT974_05656 [Cladobotryum mycophilum]|uniref:Glyoxalase/fosfomycin resistance/dioxygenase domain-containing protein n=1 Tax=Cladobotryum mycophilum TaxID=491253 RepID=A0ABR0SKH1_9HYPO